MILNKYLNKIEFRSYEEFKADFKIDIPENFNFAYDVVDEIAATDPDKIAMVWCDDKGNEAIFTFGQMKYYSDKTANFFKSQGIIKGDPVMLILKRHFEFWFCTIALNKLGAITIPATHLLSTKDIIYRNNAADIKMIVCLPDPDVIQHIEEAEGKSPTLKLKVMIGEDRESWLNFTKGMEKSSENFIRPVSDQATANTDIMLLYFTSGTTGMRKILAECSG
jgi:acetyl-CoA synthetase